MQASELRDPRDRKAAEQMERRNRVATYGDSHFCWPKHHLDQFSWDVDYHLDQFSWDVDYYEGTVDRLERNEEKAFG